MKINFIFLITIISLFLISCSKDGYSEFDDSGESTSSSSTIEYINDAHYYNTAESDEFTILKASIEDGELKLTISYTGNCSFYNVQFVDHGSFTLTNPPQKRLRLVLEINDDCNKFSEEEFSYPLEYIQLQNTKSIIFNLQDWDEPLIYEYE